MKQAEDYNEIFPIFLEENLIYRRDEDNGDLTFLSSKHPETQHLEMNSTAKFIIELCNGSNSINDIEGHIFNKYDVNEKSVVRENLISLLHNFWRLGIIDWKNNKHPFYHLYNYKKGNYLFKLLYEDEAVIKIKEIFSKSTHYIYNNPYIDKSLAFAESMLRQKIFIGQELFFEIKTGDNYLGVIGLIANPNIPSYEVSFLNFNNDYFDCIKELFPTFIIWCLNKYSEMFVFNYKLKYCSDVYLYCTEDSNVEAIEELGFRVLGLLKKEIGLKAIRIFHFNPKRTGGDNI